MPLSFESINTDLPQPSRPTQPDFPFANEGDSSHVVFSTPTAQKWQLYTAPTLDVAATINGVTVYAVGDYNLTRDDAGLVSFDRQFANIPAFRSVGAGTYAYQFPALASSVDGTPETVTAVTGNTLTITGTARVVGDFVLVNFTYTGGTSRFTARVQSKTTNTISLSYTLKPSGTFVSGTADRFNVGRTSPQALPSASVIEYSYALPGVTAGITVPADFRPDPLFQPISATTGQSVNTVDAGTVPSALEYQQMVTNGDFIAVESTVSRYLGNILERRTIKVRAL